MRTHLDKLRQKIGLKPALVEKRWLACLHRDLQTWSYLPRCLRSTQCRIKVARGSGVMRRGQGGTSASGRSALGSQIEVGMLRANYEMSNVSGC